MFTDEEKLLQRHAMLYQQLVHCEDVEEYKRIWHEYAELDMKVARIKSEDINGVMRCAYENRYKIAPTDNRHGTNK